LRTRDAQSALYDASASIFFASRRPTTTRNGENDSSQMNLIASDASENWDIQLRSTNFYYWLTSSTKSRENLAIVCQPRSGDSAHVQEYETQDPSRSQSLRRRPISTC